MGVEDLRSEVVALTSLEKELERLINEATLLLRQERNGAFEWSEPSERYEWRRQTDCRKAHYENQLKLVRQQAKQTRRQFHQLTVPEPQVKKNTQAPIELLLQLEEWFKRLDHQDAKAWVKVIRVVRSGGQVPPTPLHAEATVESRVLAMRDEGKEMREIADELQLGTLEVMRILLPREKGSK